MTTCRSGCSLLVGSFLFLGPLTSAFIAIPLAPRTSAPKLESGMNLYMKNLLPNQPQHQGMARWDNRIAPSNSTDWTSGLLRNLFSHTSDESSSTVHLEERQGSGMAMFLGIAAATLAVFTIGSNIEFPNPAELIAGAEHLFQDPTGALQEVVTHVESMGPAGALYFGGIYVCLEILAVPAIMPLTASAGYLFGVTKGTAIVLCAASLAASVSFFIGRTLLRSFVEEQLEKFPDFQKIDRAIEKEGFKLMILLRLSPIFPFALSNYLYGASSVSFWPYLLGTMVGFTPGTLAYVYSGVVGKALTLGGGDAQPWYVYAGGAVVGGAILKLVADVATSTIEELENENE